MEKQIKCIIVDDEPLAQELLASHVQKIPFLELITSCSSAIEAMEIISRQEVDLIFLDVEMPDITGLDFLSGLSRPPKVILTTAYSEYAMQGFELNVLDYLLKPISFERFFKAVQRVRPSSEPVSTVKKEDKPEKIFVKADHKIIGINLSEVLFVESMQKYVKIFHGNDVTITLMTLKRMEEILPSESFLKVHKSFIVQQGKIDRIDGNIIHIGEYTVPLSKSLRKIVLESIDRHDLL